MDQNMEASAATTYTRLKDAWACEQKHLLSSSQTDGNDWKTLAIWRNLVSAKYQTLLQGQRDQSEPQQDDLSVFRERVELLWSRVICHFSVAFHRNPDNSAEATENV